jgi:hypothetical protein
MHVDKPLTIFHKHLFYLLFDQRLKVFLIYVATSLLYILSRESKHTNKIMPSCFAHSITDSVRRLAWPSNKSNTSWSGDAWTNFWKCSFRQLSNTSTDKPPFSNSYWKTNVMYNLLFQHNIAYMYQMFWITQLIYVLFLLSTMPSFAVSGQKPRISGIHMLKRRNETEIQYSPCN